MTQGDYRILDNQPIATDIYRMELAGDTSAITRPGQFVNIEIEGLYLRRPISVCDWDNGRMTLIYKVVGRGTTKMSQMKPGTMLNLLCGLGNGFDIAPAAKRRVVLVGGGVGVPPLIGLARRLREAGHDAVSAALGFSNAGAVFGTREFEELGVPVEVATIDGSDGIRGVVTDLMPRRDGYYYFACGPQPMLRAVHALGQEGQLSFEERMGCGFGACMGCSCQTLTGPKRVCADGPVFLSGEVRFDEQA